MIINIGDIVELKKPSLHHPKLALVTNVSKRADGALVDLRWSPTHSGSVLLIGIDAVLPFEISAGPWIKGDPLRAGWYDTVLNNKNVASNTFRYFWLMWRVPVSKFASAEEAGNCAMYLEDLYVSTLISYRRQSPEYAAWLRAKGLPVGEVHGE